MVELYRREEKKKKEFQVKAAYAVEQASWPPRAGSNQWHPVVCRCREATPQEDRNG